jgi:hypothetical protein
MTPKDANTKRLTVLTTPSAPAYPSEKNENRQSIWCAKPQRNRAETGSFFSPLATGKLSAISRQLRVGPAHQNVYKHLIPLPYPEPNPEIHLADHGIDNTNPCHKCLAQHIARLFLEKQRTAFVRDQGKEKHSTLFIYSSVIGHVIRLALSSNKIGGHSPP